MWKTIKVGRDLKVIDQNTEQVIATVSDNNDPRFSLKKINDAKIISLAPQMLEALIEVSELFKKEFDAEQHPIAAITSRKIQNIINQSFTGRERSEIYTNTDFRSFINNKRNRETNNVQPHFFGEVRETGTNTEVSNDSGSGDSFRFNNISG